MATSYVLVVRDPDASNQFYTDGDVRVFDIDLGASFDHTPDDAEEAIDWVTDRLNDLADLPTGTKAFGAAMETLWEAVEAFPAAVALVDEYVEKRNSAAVSEGDL